MSQQYLSKKEVAKRMRELADNVKNNDLAVEIQELADRVEKEGDADFLGEKLVKSKSLTDWQRRFDCTVERDSTGSLLFCCKDDCLVGYETHCFHCRNFPAQERDAIVA